MGSAGAIDPPLPGPAARLRYDLWAAPVRTNDHHR
ncbi:hypothetical protein UG55_1006310 [Frankia sp. EI5c]|nr:hypothetical protein UG55_1006310 [Frankia sp. EI5c]